MTLLCLYQKQKTEHDRNPANSALATSPQRRERVNPRSGLATIIGTVGANSRVGTLRSPLAIPEYVQLPIRSLTHMCEMWHLFS